jgi:hypothetical protein
MAKQVTNKDLFSEDAFKKTTDDVSKLITELKSLETTLTNVAVKNKEILNKEDNKSIQSIQKTKEAVSKLSQAQKVSVQVEKEKLKLEERLIKSRKKQSQENQVIKEQLIAEAKSKKQLARETLGLVGAYEKESKRLNELRKKYKDLAISEGVTTKESKKLLAQIVKLDTKLKGIDRTVGQSQRNVGNYQSALSRLSRTIKTGFAAAGLTLGITAIAGAFRNTFNRIREFDKELQNISGVTGIARKDLKSLEKEIISVAGSSIKTSNEVAQLASTLFTLGNSEREVKLLLKPVNDLSIALGSTSEEAADFLGQTLNAFGKGAESGQDFADIIANVRTSTSLDFQRIKDALGFVAPTANALGLSLGQISAQIGVLQDNGIKAARAGRLLNSSFARLIKKGKSLDDALKEINESQNKVSTATNLFGAESFTLGLILADNVEKTAELANEFDNLSSGSLEKLTNEQLKSLDAQLKIVDSSWEKLILSIEKGDGKIGKAINSSLAALSKFLNFVSEGEKTRTQIVDEEGDKRAAKLITAVQKEAKTEEERVQNLKNLRSQALKNLRGFNAEVGKSQRELSNELNKEFNITGNKKLKVSLDDIQKSFNSNVIGLKETETILNKLSKQEGGFGEFLDVFDKVNETTGNLVANNKDLNDANTKVALSVVNRNKEEKLLAAIEIELNKEIKINTDLNQGNTDSKNKNTKATRELTGLIELQANEVSRLNKEIKQARTEEDILNLSKQNDVAKEELKRLKRIVSSSIEEINKIELDLIDDQTEKRIEKEIEKSDKLIKQIQTNSRAEESVKKDLIQQENQRLDNFILDQQIKEQKENIKRAAEFAKAEFEQKKTGFKTQEKFEKEKDAQFKAIQRNQLQAELDLLEFYGREKDSLRIKQLKAQLQGLNELPKALEKVELDLSQIINVIGDEINEGFEKRLAAIDNQLGKTGENIDRLRDKAQEGRLDSEESLAFEQKQEIELQRQKEREQKRQERTQAFFAVLASFNSNDGNLAKTIADVSVLKALAGGLTAFDGVDDTGGRGDLDGKGGKAWVLHPNEQVWSKKDRGEVGFRSREEMKDIVKMYDNGMLTDIMKYDKSNELINTNSFALNGMGNTQIVSKLDQLNQSIKSIQPITGSVEIDEAKKVIQYTYKKGNRVTKEISKLY